MIDTEKSLNESSLERKEQRMLDIIDEAKKFYVITSSSSSVKLGRPSFERIAHLLANSFTEVTAFVQLAFVSYEETFESILMSTKHSQTGFLSEQYRYEGKCKYKPDQANNEKLPKGRMEHIDSLFDSIDYMTVCNVSSDAMTELLRVALMGGGYSFVKKKEFIKRINNEEDSNADNEAMPLVLDMSNWKGKHISCSVEYAYAHHRYKEDKYNWLAVGDYQGNEVIVNAALLKKAIRQSMNQMIAVKDYRGIERLFKPRTEADKAPYLKPDIGVESIPINSYQNERKDEEEGSTPTASSKPNKQLLKSSKRKQLCTAVIPGSIKAKEGFMPLIHQYIYQLYQKQGEALLKEPKTIEDQHKVIQKSPLKQAYAYLTQFYFEEIYPTEKKYVLVCNEKDNRQNLISTAEYTSIEATNALPGNEPTTDCFWLKALDIKGNEFEIEEQSLLGLIKNESKFNVSEEVVDSTNVKRTLNVSYYLSSLFVKRDPNFISGLSQTDSEVIYTSIRDIDNIIHIINAESIPEEYHSTRKLADENGIEFTPNANDIKFYNKSNALHSLHLIYNDKDKKAFIPKPYLGLAIREMSQKQASSIQLLDFCLISHTIPYDHLVKHLHLSLNNKEESFPLKARANQQRPYTFISNDSNSYYLVPNFLEGLSRMKSRRDVISLIEESKSSKRCPKEVLLSIASSQNFNYEYIEIESSTNKLFYTRKVYLEYYLDKLINNQTIPSVIDIEDENGQLHRIHLHEVLLKHFMYTPLPYIKDDVLINPLNTLIETQPHCFELINNEAYRRPSVDLFEYMEIQDIHEDTLIVTKPFVRSFLFKNTPILNAHLTDFDGRMRIISPISVLQEPLNSTFYPKESNRALIDSLIAYFEVKDTENRSRLIERKTFEELESLIKSQKIRKGVAFTIVDRNKQVFKSFVENLIPISSNIRQWVLIEDVTKRKCLIYHKTLSKLLQSTAISHEVIVNDINNTRRTISPQSIKANIKRSRLASSSLTYFRHFAYSVYK